MASPSPLNEALDNEPSDEEMAFFELGASEPEPDREEPKDNRSYEPTPEELDFFELESPYQQEPMQEDVGYWRSLLNSVPRGLIEGVIRFGRMMGPLQPTGDPERDYDPERLASQLDEWFPTDDYSSTNIIKDVGKVLPTVLGTPIPGAGGGAAPSVGGTVTRATSGAALKEGASELGLPEWVQTVAEIAPWLTPSPAAANKEGASISKALTALEESSPNWAKKLYQKFGPTSLSKPLQELAESGASRKEILDFAKAANMKEAEITPLLQGEGKQKWLAKLSSKGEAMEGKLIDTKEAIGKVYNSIGELPGASIEFSVGQRGRLIKSIQDKFEKMPASVRNVIQEDFQQLISGKMDGNKLMKFFKDVNHELGPKTKQLSLLKDPIKKALMEVDPAMGQMFDMTNKLYGKFSTIAKRLKPGLSEGLWSEAKSQGALWGVISGDVGLLQKIASVSGAKKLGEFMLTSPRLQNLSGKMVSALNQGKFAVAEHIKQQMIDEIKDVDPRVAQALEELNIQEALGDR